MTQLDYREKRRHYNSFIKSLSRFTNVLWFDCISLLFYIIIIIIMVYIISTTNSSTNTTSTTSKSNNNNIVYYYLDQFVEQFYNKTSTVEV